jgi:hypothetical protein
MPTMMMTNNKQTNKQTNNNNNNNNIKQLTFLFSYYRVLLMEGVCSL